MRDHQIIDERSLAMSRAIVDRIDADPRRAGLEMARSVLARWRHKSDLAVLSEWDVILAQPWESVRRVLLDESETGKRLRQSSPFCNILTPRERWDIYRAFAS